MNTLNEFDAIIVPSTWARRVYKSSGVSAPIHVVPHGVNKACASIPLDDNYEFKTDEGKYIAEFKARQNCIIVLYFLAHSGYRKGADVVYKALKLIQEERDDIILAVKRTNLEDPYLHKLRELKMIELAGFVSDEALAEIYKASDICIVPSRGGGFELNALEAVAVGVPTIASTAGCFSDYAKYLIRVKSAGESKVLYDNIVHVGTGVNPSALDLANKIIRVANNLSRYKKAFKRYAKRVRKEFSWDKVAEEFAGVIAEYVPR